MGAESLVVGLAGTWPTAVEEAWLQQWKPFGVILFSRNVGGPRQLQELCSHLRSLVPELQIMADHEGGPVSQLADAVGRPPAAWTLGTIDDVDLTRRVHQRTAELLGEAGISWVLGPCADVMTHPHNPIIGVRAFGREPTVVSRHVAAATAGLLGGGLHVCLKHWPGHGSAGQDSHLESTIMASDAMESAVLPFGAGVSAGATAVMVGHLCTNVGGMLPATLDPAFLTATRNDLSGSEAEILLVADDITMGALREPMAALGVEVAQDSGKGMLEPATLPMGWFKALEAAGCDLLLIRGIPLAAFPVDLPEGNSEHTWQPGENNLLPVVAEYTETRVRAAVSHDFFLAEGTVLWVDLTVGDRWVVAAGSGQGRETDLHEVLDKTFGKVETVSAEGSCSSQGGIYSRVVLVSHRPLSWDNGNLPAWVTDLAVAGHAVVMGHPSLEKDFFAALSLNLQPHWHITPLFDVTGGDLKTFG